MSATRTDGQNTVPSSGASTSGSPSSIAEVLPAPRGGERSSSASAGSVGLARPHRRQRHNAGGHQNQQQQHRYHFNNLEAAMPVNIWGLDRRDVWRTCFCFHVRTVTIFIGVCHLMLYILYLSFLAAMFMYDAGTDASGLGKQIRQDQMLPTPVSVSNMKQQFNDPYDLSPPKTDSLTVDQSDPRTRLDPLHMVLDTRKANSQIVLLTMCNMLITLLMVYGAVRGKPSYLMPFFVLRVFDFCIFCLTMVGYFSYLPNVTDSISRTHWLPNRDALLDMDPQLLSLLALVTIVMFIAVKAYIIGVVWNCYKYLMLRNSVIRTVIAYRHDDPTNMMGLQQNLLPDLPDYDTAVNDPRYAKKPPIDATATSSSTSTNVNNNNGNAVISSASTVSVPPPPYSVAIAAEPLTFNFQVPNFDHQPAVISQEQTQQQAASSPITQIENLEQEEELRIVEEIVPATVTGNFTTVQVIEVTPAGTTTPTTSNTVEPVNSVNNP